MQARLALFAGLALVACSAAPPGAPAPVTSEVATASARRLPADCYKSRHDCKMIRRVVDDGPRVDPEDPNRAAGTFQRDTASVRFVDGAGNEKGTIKTRNNVRVNYGSRKKIYGVEHVFGFAFEDTRDNHASAWLPVSVFEPDDQRRLSRMPDIDIRGLSDGVALRHKTSYELVGATQSERDQYKSRGKYCSITDFKNAVGRKSPADYLDDRYGLVDLLYSVPATVGGGQSRDTYTVDDGVVFSRAREPSVRPRSPGERCRRMRFVFGKVVTQEGGGRYGWFPYDVLRRSR